MAWITFALCWIIFRMLRTLRAKRLRSAPLWEMMLRQTCSPRSFAPQIRTFIFCSRICRAESQLTAIEGDGLVISAGGIGVQRVCLSTFAKACPRKQPAISPFDAEALLRLINFRARRKQPL